ncbi:hypothetical protein EMCRGX_G000979 [Ephydatia muelleri]
MDVVKTWKFERCLANRSAMYSKKALYKKKKVAVKAPKVGEKRLKEKPVKGEKNGGKRLVVVNKTRRYYPTEDLPTKIRNYRKLKPVHLRSSIVPGTVLILLAGKHKGKRVIFLKQLPSGLLLVTGPFCINGVPLRRVAQSYVIATKTRIDVSQVKLPETLTDDYFRRTKAEKKKKSEGAEIFEKSGKDYKVSDKRKEDQKTVDKQLTDALKAQPQLRQYLKTLFTLQKGQYPHRMVF